MSFLIFVGAIAGIFLIAVIVNRITGTKATYIETFQPESDETILWRDDGADFGIIPRTNRAMFRSYARLRRHTIIWSSHRIIVAQKVLFQSKKMITHLIYFQNAKNDDATTASQKFGTGFLGRGFITVIAKEYIFDKVNQKDCVRLIPTEQSGATSGIHEALVFTDQIDQLRASIR